MGNKRDKIEIIAIAVFFAAIVLFTGYYGRSHVVGLNETRVVSVSDPHEAYFVWKDAGVRGRILLLFDRHLNAEPLSRKIVPKEYESLLAPQNYIYVAAGKGLLRKIYHIIPDSSWAEVRQALEGYALVSFSNDIFNMTIEEGVPVYIMRKRNIPHFKEDVLVGIQRNAWDSAGFREILEEMKRKNVKADIITLSGEFSGEELQLIRGQYGPVH